MKNLKIFSLAVMLLVAMVGCKPEPAPVTFVPGDVNKIVNEWHLVEFAGQPAEFDVYVDFNEDATFEMYERNFTYEYVYSNGDYVLSGNDLTGTYADGTEWNYTYRAEVSADGKVLRLHTTDGTMSVYKQEAIPESVKANAVEPASVRATGYFL